MPKNECIFYQRGLCNNGLCKDIVKTALVTDDDDKLVCVYPKLPCLRFDSSKPQSPNQS